MEVECKCKFFWTDPKDEIPWYTCVIESADINERNTKIKEFAGTHLPGKSNKDVEAIHFYDTNVHYLPRGLDLHFPNLKGVTIVRCGLKELSKRDLLGLENLTVLEIVSNELEEMPLDLLQNMKTLVAIVFVGNHLKFVDSRMFEHLKGQLEELDLSDNTSTEKLCYDLEDDNDDNYNNIEDLLKSIDKNFAKPEGEQRFDLKKANADYFELDFEQLWKTRDYADFTIIVDEQEIKAHKSVLGIRSSVFAAMFNSEMEEAKTGRMTIVDFSFGSVEDFLRALYTGVVSQSADVTDVFALAKKYIVGSSVSGLEEIIARNIDRENMIDILQLGNLYDSEVLIKNAFDEIKLANPGLEIADKMKNHPEKVEKLIAAKIQLELEISEAHNRFRQTKIALEEI